MSNIYQILSESIYLRFKSPPRGGLPPSPFILGICGSVAVGKTTLSQHLQTILSQWPERPRVDLVSSDGFLFPAAVLNSRGLMSKKGFPESYDIGRLSRFLQAIKSGQAVVEAPVYSHAIYDIIDEVQQFHSPDILIIEGVNLLQQMPELLDFSIFLDAPSDLIKSWYLERFKNLLQLAKDKPSYYLYPYTKVPEEQAVVRAEQVWETVNEPNLVENILPYKHRADLIVEKSVGHTIYNVIRQT